MEKNMLGILLIATSMGAILTSFLAIKFGMTGLFVGVAISALIGLVFRIIFGKAS